MTSPARGRAAPRLSPIPNLHQTLKLTTIDLIGGIFCHICQLTFGKKQEYDNHYAQHKTGSSDIVYTCVACRKEIVGYASFRNHCYSRHIVKDRFKCENCPKRFSRASILLEHKNTVHTFQCGFPKCNKKFPSKKELHLHEVFHNCEVNSPPYACKSCSQKINTIDACEDHLDKHYTITYACPICQIKFPKEEAMNHLSIHFGEVLKELNMSEAEDSTNFMSEDSSINVVGGILCCYCENQFKNRTEFDTHFAESHKELTLFYKCIICNKTFEKYHFFGSHCYEHCMKNRFECEICCKRFPRLSLLVVHMEAHRDAPAIGVDAGIAGENAVPTGENAVTAGEIAVTTGENAAIAGMDACGVEEARIPCPHCTRRFVSVRRLRDHLRESHPTDDLVCPHQGCKQKLESTRELILHRNYHESDLNHWCRICGLRFHSFQSCERHLDVHKSMCFSCPVCERKYNERYLLMKHISAHFETTLHFCNVCGKCYKARNRLIAHSKSHAATKDFKCKICGKEFIRSERLKNHLILHTGERPFACPKCSKTFASYSNWHKHLRTVCQVDPKTVARPVKDLAAVMNMIESVPTPEDSVAASDDLNITDLVDIADMMPTDVCDLEELVNTVLPDDIAAFSPEVLSPSAPAVTPVASTAGDMPREYGPDFSSHGWDDVISLGEPPLPHIDPLLTINPPTPEKYPFDYDPMESIDPCPKWEPPVITKFYVF